MVLNNPMSQFNRRCRPRKTPQSKQLMTFVQQHAKPISKLQNEVNPNKHLRFKNDDLNIESTPEENMA
jgi:hypothetical protein